MGPIDPVWALAAIHPWWGSGKGLYLPQAMAVQCRCLPHCIQFVAMEWNENHPEYMQSWPTLEDFLLVLRIFCNSMALFGVRRGFKMILCHRAPSSVNMSSYRAIWTHFRSNSIIFGQNNPRSIYLNFKIPKSGNPENRSLVVGRQFFRKLCASRNDAEPYRRNILGLNFQKHPLFQFTGLWFLNLRSWYQDLGTKILVPRSWGEPVLG